ncbi:MAG: O-antigen ligase family protein [Bacteroidota bacterium]
MTSVVYSPFLLSVAMIALAVLCFFEFEITRTSFKIWGNSKFFQSLGQYPQHPSFWIPSLVFFLVFFSFWDIVDTSYWWERVRIKVPFLALGMLFMVLPKLTEVEFKGLLYFLVFLMTVTSLAVGVNYFMNMAEINELMKQGHPMPTPRNHIRYSLMLALSVIAAFYLWQEKFVLKYQWERPALLGATIFLLVFIHFLSVRTGILSLYIAIFALAVRQAILWKKWWLIGLTALILSALPVVGYYTIPSFQTKINYMRWDLMQFREGKGEEYADSGRLSSLVVGWELLQEQPLLGVGAGNLRIAVQERYKERFPKFEQVHMPHNQFLFIAVGSGMLGLGLFIFAILFPFFYQKNLQHPILLTFYSISLVAFMLEHTIENSIGVGFFCFFLFLFLNVYNRREA